MKFLVVDDSAMARCIVVDALNQLGFTETVEARDGHEALLRSYESIGFIVTAVHMPKMSGTDLVRAVRSRPLAARIPALIMAAVGEAASVQSLGTDAIDHIEKPFSVQDLRAKITGLIGGHVAPRLPRRRPPAELLFDSEASFRLVDQALVDLRMPAEATLPMLESVHRGSESTRETEHWLRLLRGGSWGSRAR
jgi:two-component system, chemotaxis family, chemotaxis protein CheY